VTSALPWFEDALNKRILHAVAEGHTERQARLTATLRLKSLDDSTERSYANAWRDWCSVCAANGRVAMPASASAGVAYIAAHVERGTVHQKSLSGYVSAVNRAHEDMMFPPVFEKNDRGHFVDVDVRRLMTGLGKAQGKRLRDAADTDRLYLPAHIPARLLSEAAAAVRDVNVADVDAVQGVRDDLAISFSFADFGRGQSQSGLQPTDIGISSEKSLSFKFRVAKGSTKHKHNLSFHWPPESIPALIAAMESYAQLRARLGCTHDQYWRLPWEAKKLVSADFGKMLARSLARRGLSAPKGFVYSMHSVRAGAQSAAAAIGVTVVTIRHQGGYVPGSNVPEQKYIDPSCPPSPAAVLFFGWLRPSPSS